MSTQLLPPQEEEEFGVEESMERAMLRDRNLLEAEDRSAWPALSRDECAAMARDINERIRVYIHVALLGGSSQDEGRDLVAWQDILDDFIREATTSGLRAVAEEIVVVAVGGDEDEPPSSCVSSDGEEVLCNSTSGDPTAWIEARYNNGTGKLPFAPVRVRFFSGKFLNFYEYATLKVMYSDAVAEASSGESGVLALYVHTKGVGKPYDVVVDHWRKFMAHHLLGPGHCRCLEHLHEPYPQIAATAATCGVDLSSSPLLHYSGNFWWARFDYLAGLQTPESLFDFFATPNPLWSTRHNQEFWIASGRAGSGDGRVHVSIQQSNVEASVRFIARRLHPPERYRHTPLSSPYPRERNRILIQPPSPQELAETRCCTTMEVTSDRLPKSFFRAFVPLRCTCVNLKAAYPGNNDSGVNGSHLPVEHADLFDQSVAVAVMHALVGRTQLTAAWLGYNRIGMRGADTLATEILSHPGCKLIDLGLAGNQIGDAGVGSIAQALALHASPDMPLQSLGLSSNQIGDRGAIALAKSLRIHRSARELDLSRNALTDLGVLEILATLQCGACRLKVLALYSNPGITDASALAFAGALSSGRVPLEELYLQHTSIDARGTAASALRVAASSAGVILEL